MCLYLTLGPDLSLGKAQAKDRQTDKPRAISLHRVPASKWGGDWIPKAWAWLSQPLRNTSWGYITCTSSTSGKIRRITLVNGSTAQGACFQVRGTANMTSGRWQGPNRRVRTWCLNCELHPHISRSLQSKAFRSPRICSESMRESARAAEKKLWQASEMVRRRFLCHIEIHNLRIPI